ncbi:MAG: CehA/McbA family metallohydrolase, partial [Candidatus Hydrogenedentes bacterium]|nr:CehA/McbA family metallohydrolase [Candidatus Hydrogenedentota bacterium]
HGARGYPIDAALGARFTLDMLTLESDSAPYEVKLRDYMRLLNCGARIGVSASTDFHVDQAREPIGGMRTYVDAEALEWPEIAEAYREGRTFATNGPLVSVSVNGAGIGETVNLGAPGEISVQVTAQSIWGIDSVELWQDGSLVAMLAASNGRVDEQITLPVQRSGWLLAIVKGPAAPEVMNAPEGNAMVEGQYAITSPVYLDVAGVPLARAPEAAQYFLEWIDVVESGFLAACARVAPEGSPVPRERQETVLKRLETAREFYREHLRTP